MNNDPCLQQPIKVHKNDIINNYEVLDGIGKGGFSFAAKGLNILEQDPNKKIVTLKFVDTGRKGYTCEQIKRYTNSEITILKKINRYCGSVSCYYDSFYYGTYIVLVSKYIPGHPLDSFNEIQLDALNILWVKILLDTLYNLHYIGVTHNDIKGSNIIFDTSINRPVFIDFGLSTCTDELCKNRGTAGYKAPEINNRNSDTRAIDVFALGVTLLKIKYKRIVLAKDVADTDWILSAQRFIKKNNPMIAAFLDIDPNIRYLNFLKAKREGPHTDFKFTVPAIVNGPPLTPKKVIPIVNGPPLLKKTVRTVRKRPKSV